MARLTARTAYGAATRFLDWVGPYPSRRFHGRGVVICAGGPIYIPCAWVCINMLRRVGCELPIEVWALDADELDPTIRRLLKPLGVRCINAAAVRKKFPATLRGGWELKPYAIIHSRFEEVLFLDADNVAVADPTFLFHAREYKQLGAVFWPGPVPLRKDNRIWNICRVPYRLEPEFETGQMLINKAQCWKALQLTMHINEHSDFYYQHIHGDKDTFHMAWHMVGQNYQMVQTPMEWFERLWGATQFDLEGKRLFQHRNGAKWELEDPNPVVPRFVFEQDCFQFLDELREVWSRWADAPGAEVAPKTLHLKRPNGIKRRYDLIANP